MQNNLLEPKDITIIDASGKERQFILSKFPAIQGREIVAKYPTSSLPKIGDYAVSEETMLKLMAFVGVRTGDIVTRLDQRTLVDNHVGDWETLMKIEMAMMEYNCSFFRNGRISDFLQDVALKHLPQILKTLTDSLGQSSPTEKPASTS